MPTYVFKCPKCNGKFEQMLTLKEYSENHRPRCVEEGCDGQQIMETALQPAGLVFKGSGWTPKGSGR